MSGEQTPGPGQMILYDFMAPPLTAGSYRLDASTTVQVGKTQEPSLTGAGYFEVVGPRFSLSATEVSGVFPPSNARGSYDDVIPHIALGRRTLPWERVLDKAGKIKAPKHPVSPAGPRPWMALLLFEAGEYSLLENQRLEDVVSAPVFTSLGSPAGIRCNAIEVDTALLEDVLPSVEELQLLTHVRQVNVEDRELSAGDSDGWFSVVMSNRLPGPGAECRACLVSLEERWDLIAADPPPTASLNNETFFDPIALDLPLLSGPVVGTAGLAFTRATTTTTTEFLPHRFRTTSKLVLLFSWKYFNEGAGSFRDLMQGLDVAMMGTVRGKYPKVADTGHIPVTVHNRAGADEQEMYRGPLAPYPLTRDPLGPYHSADQARRVTPETGAEDVSYAAAFEVGRLLAAADGRLAQELMRWRRDAYRQSARADQMSLTASKISLLTASSVHVPFVPVVSASAIARVLAAGGPVSDPSGLAFLGSAPGLNPARLQSVWNLASLEVAQAILGAPSVSPAQSVEAPPTVARSAVTIEEVAANTALLANLNRARDQMFANTAVRLEGQP